MPIGSISVVSRGGGWRRASKRIKRRVSKRSQVAAQAYWYVGGLIGVWTVPTINRVLGFFGIVLYPLTLLHAIFSPLQGVSSRM